MAVTQRVRGESTTLLENDGGTVSEQTFQAFKTWKVSWVGYFLRVT